MAYDLHIERIGGAPITLEEWRAATASTDGIRLRAAVPHTITNPKTGEIISMSSREGDAEVFFTQDDRWQFVFRWRGDSAVFAARFDPIEPSHPVWAAAVGLASHLGAKIRGDDGEVYDFQTGKVTNG